MNRNHWNVWARFLHRWGLSEIALTMIEASRPVHGLMAQFIYLSSPTLSTFIAPNRIEGFAAMLEDPDESRSFAAFLQEESDR